MIPPTTRRFFRYVWLVLALAGCTKAIRTPDVDPYKLPESQFRRRVKVVAVAPITIPAGLQDPTPVENTFNGLIADKLARARFSIVHPQDYKTVWDRVVADMGGLGPTDTGERDPRRVTEAMVKTIDALKADFRLDAVLIPSVTVVEARFAAGRAYWDGAVQGIKTGGALQGFFSGSPEGTVGALSLQINILDPSGNTLYARSGGIEVLSKLEGSDFVLVPRPELFTNEERNRKAVDIALDPLLR
jgi:hypothetical protein